MVAKKIAFQVDANDVLRIPAFVTRIDKSKAFRRRSIITMRMNDGIDGKSCYFAVASEQTSPPMMSTLLEHEAIEYGYKRSIINYTSAA